MKQVVKIPKRITRSQSCEGGSGGTISDNDSAEGDLRGVLSDTEIGQSSKKHGKRKRKSVEFPKDLIEMSQNKWQ